MKKILSTIVIILLLGILIPTVFIRDSYREFSQDDHDTVVMITRQLLENPIESMLILKITVDGTRNDTVNTSAYTFWGIKYATVELDSSLNGNSHVTWRRWGN